MGYFQFGLQLYTNVRGEEAVPSWDGATPVLIGYFCCHKMDIYMK